MKNIIKNVVSAVLLAAIIGFMVWLALRPPMYETENSYKIPATELTVLEKTTNISGSEQVSRITEYYLLDQKGDTLAKQLSPYQNAGGLVFMISKGLYDCRSEKPVLLIERGDITENYLYFHQEEDSILILDGRDPIIQVFSEDDSSQCKKYSYNLTTNELRVCN